VVTDFVEAEFDSEAEFVKIGNGSLGGKARGLAFFSTLLRETSEIQASFPDIQIGIPKTLVITTEGFDTFMAENNLKELSFETLKDHEIEDIFLKSKFSDSIRRNLEIFLSQTNYPLAVRSSSLLEDSQSQPFAGIYQTYMIPNAHQDLSVRTDQLVQAIKLVYASTFLETSRAFAESTLNRTEEEKMAVIVQQIVGNRYGDMLYPAISGVAQSYNFYPVSHLKPEDGVAHIALGLGKTVVDGGTALRFSPKYPEFLPGFSSVEEILDNSQRMFYALDMAQFPSEFGASYDAPLVRVEIDDVPDQFPVKYLCSTYMPEEHRIRDSSRSGGYPVLTFANLLKYKTLPLSEILLQIMELGRKGMGGSIEIEFALDLSPDSSRPPTFSLLQIRPMVLGRHQTDVKIHPEDIQQATGYSNMALGNGLYDDIEDIVYVKPHDFDPGKTMQIAAEVGKINYAIKKTQRKYLLVGPGRWGSADRWLGIPVKWNDISSVGVIVETASDKLRAAPSQGTHFFHNITSMGISYITINPASEDFFDWTWLETLPMVQETHFVRHVKADTPPRIKLEGRTSRAVIIK